MTNLQVKINPKEYGLEEQKATEMISGLNITIAERQVLENAYIDVIELDIDEDNLAIFKELRLKIVKNRTQGIVKWHATNKAFYLAGGRFVDAIKNREIAINEAMESKLLGAEKYFENLEKEKLEKIQKERLLLIQPFLESIENLFLADMDEDVWDAYLLTKKNKFEELAAEKQRIENERLELERLEKVRIEKQRIENEKLKLEAQKREKEIEVERKKQSDLLAKQKADSEKLAKIESDKQEAILLKERKEKLKLEAELKSKKDAEIKAENERKLAEEKAKKESDKLAKAPVKNQLNIWVDDFNIDLPNSELLNNDTALAIKLKFESFKKWAKQEVDKI